MGIAWAARPSSHLGSSPRTCSSHPPTAVDGNLVPPGVRPRTPVSSWTSFFLSHSISYLPGNPFGEHDHSWPPNSHHLGPRHHRLLLPAHLPASTLGCGRPWPDHLAPLLKTLQWFSIPPRKWGLSRTPRPDMSSPITSLTSSPVIDHGACLLEPWEGLTEIMHL